MKKKIIALCLIVALVAIALISGTLAYFTDTEDATNVFTVGNVNIELLEPNWNTNGNESDDVYPGEPLPKDPMVKNIGANPCFVRIKVTGLDCLKVAGLSAENVAYRTNYVVGALGDKWADGGDGYFYYVGVLAKDETTSAVFDSIVIPTDVVNATGALDISYEIEVYAEAIQAQGAQTSWPAVEAMDLDAIKTWFATVIQ